MALALMTDMKKLCNAPELIHDAWKDQIEWDPSFDPRVYQPQFSGKLQVLDNLLTRIHSIQDKCVIVSNYTQTLEVLGRMCVTRGWKFFQLDGSTKVTRRQELVDIFNDPRAPECSCRPSFVRDFSPSCSFQ
jgi:SNF2 family DNA or RNA helicase